MATLDEGQLASESQESLNMPELLLREENNREPAAESGQSNHGEHDAIFCLLKKCSGCSKKVKPGTCFLMSNLNEDGSDYFHFATCAHMLYCFPCKTYMHLSPSARFNENGYENIVPGGYLHQFSEPGDDWGWVRVPEAYQRAKGFIHDYGLLAVKKDKVLPKIGEKMKAAMKNMVPVNPQSRAGFYPRGYLCGYESRTHLYCSADDKDAPSPPRQGNAKCDKLRRRKKERTTDGLYSTKQDHFERDAIRIIWKGGLLRYYLDSTGGQSGSPIRLPTGEAVGIHCGYRRPRGELSNPKTNSVATSAKYHGCNVAVHLLDRGVLEKMETWVKDGGKRTDSSSAVAGSSPDGGVDEVESDCDDFDIPEHFSLRDCDSSSDHDGEEEEDNQSKDEQLEPTAKVARNPDQMSGEGTEGC